VAPEIWGSQSLFFSALDEGNDRFRTHADREAHGGEHFMAWFLTQVQRFDQQTGRRSLDVLSVHNYPQNGVYPEGDDPQKNALRLRSTQQLWNGNYTDESWISRTEAAQLALIPRLRNLVNAYYPGTMIGITEWNYGADATINGGLTIADVLGIFGREGLDLASYWTVPKPGTPGASAFKIYGNYDGCGRHFGDQILRTWSSDEQTLSVYGSRDSFTGDVLFLMVNKVPNKSVQANFNMPGIGERTAKVYQFDAEHPTIRRVADTETGAMGISYSVPPYSVTLFVIGASRP